MPQQRELPVHGMTAFFKLLEQGQGFIPITEAEVARSDHTTFHGDQGSLDQA